MSTINKLREYLSQAERDIENRQEALAQAQDHEKRVAEDCFMDPRDPKYAKARRSTRRARQKLESAYRAAAGLRSTIKERLLYDEIHSKTPSSQQQPVTSFEDAIHDWRAQCDALFFKYASLKVFPTPPTDIRCTKQACQTEDRALNICQCQIRHAFSSVPNLDLKRERATRVAPRQILYLCRAEEGAVPAEREDDLRGGR